MVFILYGSCHGAYGACIYSASLWRMPCPVERGRTVFVVLGKIAQHVDWLLWSCPCRQAFKHSGDQQQHIKAVKHLRNVCEHILLRFVSFISNFSTNSPDVRLVVCVHLKHCLTSIYSWPSDGEHGPEPGDRPCNTFHVWQKQNDSKEIGARQRSSLSRRVTDEASRLSSASLPRVLTAVYSPVVPTMWLSPSTWRSHFPIQRKCWCRTSLLYFEFNVDMVNIQYK